MILSPLLALTLFEKSSTGVWKGILIIWLIAMSVVILQMNFYNLFFVSVLSWSGFLKMYTVAYLPLVLIYFIWKFFDKDSNI
jgi:amino acid permease